MATQGIFSLGESELELSNGAWSSDPQYGYYFGGFSPASPSPVSSIRRITFANDTLNASSKGSLIKNSADGSAVTDLRNYAYLIGGWDAPGTTPTSIVQRIDYSNDLADSRNRSLATVAKYGGGQFFTANHGWMVGASVEPASPRERTYVDRLSFANDSLYMSIRGPLSSARYKGSSVQNDSYGWFSGGYAIAGAAVRHTRVDRIDFNSDLSITSARRNDTIGGSFAAGASSKIYGWSIGQRSTGVDQGTTVERMTFANDTAGAVLRGPTLVAKFNHNASYNSSSGWVGGGRDTAPTPSHFSRIDRFSYENDLASFSARANFPTVSATAPATQGQLSRKNVPLNSQYGWCIGGYVNPPFVSAIERIDFDNDQTIAANRTSLTIEKNSMGAAGNNNYAWITGGQTAPAVVSTVERLNYASDNQKTITRGPLSLARRDHSSVSTPDYVWNLGGSFGLSTIDRIDVNNDQVTASARTNFSSGQGYGGAVQNSTYGWLCGHLSAPGATANTTIQRIEFQNDLASSSTRGPLSRTTFGLLSCENNLYGYVAGGYPSPGFDAFSTIDRIDFSNDTPTATARGNLTTKKGFSDATSNNSYGWWAGGYNYPAVPRISSIERSDWSTDTSTSISRGPLSVAKQVGGAASGIIQSIIANPLSVPTTAQYGYNAAGGPAPTVSTVKRIDFNNDTVTVPIRGSLTGGRTYHAGLSNSSYGWVGGGGDYPVPLTATSRVERLDLQNDTSNTTIRGVLNVVRNGPGAFISQSYGYFVGGNAGSPGGTHYTTTDRLDLSNDLPTTSSRGNLAAARYLPAYDSTQSYGYLFAGYATPGPAAISSTERFDFASDLSAGSLRANFPAAFAQQTATGNGSYAWIATPDGNQSTVHRLDYSSDLSSPPTRGPLSLGRRNGALTGNGNYGWVVGGVATPVYSVVDRIDFANDNAVASVRGNLPTTQRSGAPFAALARKILTPITLPKSGTYGWWGAGRLPASHSRVSRLDYANDLSIANSVGPLVAATGYRAVVGNKDSGWFVCGQSFGSPTQQRSGVDRIDFTNDLSNGSARTNLTTGRTHPSGVGNANYGWICGGTISPSVDTTSVERIDYINDTTTPLSRGPITQGRRHFCGTSNKDFGYNVAGYSPTGYMTTVDRVNFSNDLSTALALPDTTPHYGSGVTGNKNYGWFGGGQENVVGYSTIIRRIDFSNDSPGFSARGTITIGRRYTNATGNEDYGWWGGGINSSEIPESRFERLEFANDLSTTSVRGNLSIADYQTNGVTNKSTGH